MPKQPVWRWLAASLALLLVGVAPLRAQVRGVDLRVPRAFLGLGGVVRPGTWTPIRLTLRNHGADPRAVLCRWRVRDADGDRVIAQRRATLSPNRDQYVWLYAVPPAATGREAQWTVQVVAEKSGALLAAHRIDVRNVPSVAPPDVGVIGVLGTADMDLKPYTRQYTQHEKLGLIRGMKLAALPDRWFGLSTLHALIWTQGGGDPNDAAFLPSMQQALREWVRRGGRLVIVLPPIGQPWSGSPLADLMPVGPGNMRRVQAPPPAFLYDVRPSEPVRIQMTVFDHPRRNHLAVLARTRDGQPVIVSKRYGFGRVTLVGVNLAGQVSKLGMPSGRFPVWNRIFNWHAPVFSRKYARTEMHNAKMSRPDNRMKIELGGFIPALISMTSTAAPALLSAVVVFVLYWLAAGPVGFALLKRRGAARHSWLIFVAVVGVFTAAAWGGAWLAQPDRAAIAHFSVLDVDGHTGETHVHSWLSLFVPRFGKAKVALGSTGRDAAGPDSRDTLASTGLLRRGRESSFLESQSYKINAAAPDDADIPFRATAKQLELDYHGRSLSRANPPASGGVSPAGVEESWVTPQGRLHVDPTTGFPIGKLQHDLPGTLQNVLIVFCPGGGADPRPWVWRVGPWPAGKVLHVGPPAQMHAAADRLVKTRDYDQKRLWKSEGFLGRLMANRPGRRLTAAADPLAVHLATDERIKMIELLSFYDALPPPDYRSTDFTSPAPSYQRALGRSLDISDLTDGRRVIIIGYLANSPLPAPLTLDGRSVHSHGWTVLRWIYDLD